MGKHAVKIRPDLRVMVDEGVELVIERVVTPGIKRRISLKTDEWHELRDWVQAIYFLSLHQNDRL